MKLNHLKIEANGYGSSVISVWVELSTAADVDELIHYLQDAKRFTKAWHKRCEPHRKKLALARSV